MAGGWKGLWRTGIKHVRDLARRGVRAARPLPHRRRLGVALSGGFARSLAHIGALKVLEENQIPIDYLAGTSAGSIIAGAYASGASPAEIAAAGARLRWKDFGRWTLSRMGLASNERLETLIGRLFRAARFENTRIPLAIVATDLRTGQPVVFTSGAMAFAVRASCAYPGLFLPVAYNDTWLVDGGLVAPVPAAAVRALGADVVLGINLDNIEPTMEPKSMVDVLGRSLSIAQRTGRPVWRQHADVVVEPTVNSYAWDDFEKAEEMIAGGEAAMRAALPQLQALLKPPPTAARRAAVL